MIREIDSWYGDDPWHEWRTFGNLYATPRGGPVNLAGLDMNLVVALRVLLEERNVTRAGQQIGLSQPAMSAALARLRRHFGDELLSRDRGSYELTALGTVLLDRSRTACEMLERVFASQAQFDPMREEREFTILASDYAVAVFGVRLAAVLHAQAPRVRITFRQPPASVVDDPAALLSSVDGLLMPHGVITSLPAVELYRDGWKCVVARDNADVGDTITLEQLAELPWAAYQRTFDATVARQLSMLGVEPHVQVSVDNFQLLPAMVTGTRRIALVQALLAERIAGDSGVRVLECPFEAVPVHEALWWHPVHTHDAGHRWLRETAAQVGTMVSAVR
jgi:DNA-binding transcriptional LysR family regulator